MTSGILRTNRPLFLVGGGKMGLALLNGWLKSGRSGSDTVVVDPMPSDALRAVTRKHGVSVLEKVDPSARAGVVVLAVKPQIARDVAKTIASIVDRDTLVVSIMAGAKLATLRAWFPAASSIIRAMPNLPASVGWSATVAVADNSISDGERRTAKRILEATGIFEWLTDEGHLDIATGLSGSGPAYVFYLVDCLAQSAVRLGLDPEVAARLARATVEGAGALLRQSPQSSEQLRVEVASPNGTTEVGLRILMDGRLQGIINATVEAAAARSRELSTSQ